MMGADMDNPATITTEILSEVKAQRARWGVGIDDTKNTPWMWASYITQYATRWMSGTFMPIPRPQTIDFRFCMVKVAALAISAIDSVDRQRANNGSTFYEERADV